ncbi:MAG: hypothetical protein IJM90_01440 [Firmicutes bacterium]|nr:hypothetical protein [Bacillota bacterium]
MVHEGNFPRQNSGEVTLPLSPGGYAGRCYYSKPVSHGLGKGPVGLSLALKDPSGALLYGNAAVWAAYETIVRLPDARLGALLQPDEGSFVIGVRLLENTSARELTVLWSAWRTEDPPVTAEAADEEPFYILEVPNYLRAGEQFAFTVVKPQGGPPVVWSITEPQGGRIREDGVYTAPDHAGVFEIKASWGGRTASVYLMIKDSAL